MDTIRPGRERVGHPSVPPSPAVVTIKFSVMKKLLVLSAACLMVLGTTRDLRANAIPEPGARMLVSLKRGPGMKTIDVYLANLLDKRTQVSVQGMDGKLWFSEYAWGEAGYAKRLNLAEVPQGNYLLYVENKDERHLQMIAIGEMGMDFFRTMAPVRERKAVALLAGRDDSRRGGVIGYITQPNEHAVGVQLANLERWRADVRILALGESIAYEEAVSDVQGYARLIDFEGMPSGNYYVCVETHGVSIVQFFNWSGEGLEFQEMQRFIDPSVRRRGWAAR